MRPIDADEFECVTLKECSDEFAEGAKYILEMVDKAPTINTRSTCFCPKKVDKVFDFYNCPNCMAKLKKGENYCWSCGVDLDWKEEQK